jgi:hypothetical protein
MMRRKIIGKVPRIVALHIDPHYVEPRGLGLPDEGKDVRAAETQRRIVAEWL